MKSNQQQQFEELALHSNKSKMAVGLNVIPVVQTDSNPDDAPC